MFKKSFGHGRLLKAIALLLCVTLTSLLALAQATAPRAELFAGYSWLHPGGDFDNHLTQFGVQPGQTLKNMPRGFDVSAAYNFTKWIGVQVDGGNHWSDSSTSFLSGFHNAMVLAGPKLSFRTQHFSPFAELEGGWGRITGRGATADGFAALVGGGLDVYFARHWAVRLFQADYVYQGYKVSDVGSGTFNGGRLQAGLVYGIGQIKPPEPPAATCTVQPTAVLAGEPVTATVATQNFNPKHKLTYEWSASGGKVAPSDTTANIDTASLAPGNYTVTSTVTDAKAPKNYQAATCTGNFTINAPPMHPPTISCSPNPATVRSGDPSTITCRGNSPDNRPLTYACRPNAGRISGNGPVFTLDTAGVPAGTITVNCTTTDDRGLSASTSTSVQVQAPPPAPQASKIGEIVFPNKAKPWRVDNTAKAILDDVALRMQREAGAKAVIVGYVNPAEKGGMGLAQQRAVNTKAYLTQEKGIDPARIEVRTGTAGGNRAEIYLVPAGAMFNVPGTVTFDESKVKPSVDHAARRPAKKAAPAKAKPAAKQ